MTKIAGLLRSTRAATAVEYGLILALIFLTAILAITSVGNGTVGMWNSVATKSASVL